MIPVLHFVGLRGYVLKIRIFALARDLGLDSKVLIELCEEAGVKYVIRLSPTFGKRGLLSIRLLPLWKLLLFENRSRTAVEFA